MTAGHIFISHATADDPFIRDPALATDPNLDCRDTVELQLLLEALGS